jgi:HSP20 family protein
MTKNGEVALIRRGSTALAKPMEPLEDFVLPAADIYETSEAFVLNIDMPGVKKESISIHVEPHKLQVKGILNQLHGDNVNIVYGEMRKASYYREFNIGNGIDTDTIEAMYQDGVLTMILHKNESMKAREIPIR